MHVIEPLGALVEWCERVVVDRPRRRDPVGVLDSLEVFAAKAKERAAPELCVPADAVVGIRAKFRLRPASLIHPPFVLRTIAAVFPHRFRAPVLFLLRNEIAALEDQDAGGGF
jgi:hypothetical protein